MRTNADRQRLGWTRTDWAPDEIISPRMLSRRSAVGCSAWLDRSVPCKFRFSCVEFKCFSILKICARDLADDKRYVNIQSMCQRLDQGVKPRSILRMEEVDFRNSVIIIIRW